jgi:hypothetical protein
VTLGLREKFQQSMLAGLEGGCIAPVVMIAPRRPLSP